MTDTLTTKPGIGPGLPLPVAVHLLDGTFGEDDQDEAVRPHCNICWSPCVFDDHCERDDGGE